MKGRVPELAEKVLVLEPYRCFARVEIRALDPPPLPLPVGVAYPKEAHSAPAAKLVGALKLARQA